MTPALAAAARNTSSAAAGSDWPASATRQCRACAPLAVKGHTSELDGAKGLPAGVLGYFAWLRLLWMDGGYSGPAFAQWVKGLRRRLVVEVAKCCDDAHGFRVLPQRRVVERTFGWLIRQRRVIRDYETNAATK